MEKLVFFVDDDKMILNLLEYTVKARYNFNVNIYYDGETCLANLRLKPDLIVLDYPFKSNEEKKMSGMDVLLEIRKKNRGIPVVILTAIEDEDLARKFMENGASEYIRKDDYFIDELMETISSNLSC